MSHVASTRTTLRSRRPGTVGLAVVAAAIIGTLAHQSASSLSLARTVDAVVHGEPRASAIWADGVVTEADGVLPNGATAFDEEYPGVANLDRDLLDALRRAATDAVADGIELHVNSGWRSADYQNQLLRDAVAEYGSEEEAGRWVASPDRSAHVSGDAVDIGPLDATSWLTEHGAEYGLCRIYANEAWHYELRREAIGHGCPAMYADPTHDPRMQQ